MKLNSKKLKGATLIEVILYLALFGFIFTTIISFFLVINEFNRNDKYQIDLAKGTIFVVEHLEETFKDTKSIDVVNSVFDNNNGVLTIIKNDNSTVNYSVINNRISVLTSTTNYISPSGVTINKFRFQKIINNNVVVGVRFELDTTSEKSTRINKTVSYTYVIQ